MILSAKFGDGKSFFLQKIREDVETFKEYEFITLYPVNYVVAPNEDIFEYIKRDILVQLVRLKLLNKIDLNKLITSVFSFESFKKVISFLISCIPDGAFYNKILEKALDISKKYKDEKATYDKYFGSFKAQKGGLYEEDAYTKIIIEALNLLKNGYIDDKNRLLQKKPVLIIEDLDRLDPAHLFRILNVISAHIDDAMQPDKVGNKFGFSNIVIVMDYDTTRHIFEHFYGRSASYEGYMSKFITEEPFKYSITELALPKLKEKIANTIDIDPNLLDGFSIFNRKLANFSMRDIQRLYDLDITCRIKQKEFVVTSDITISMLLPVFKLFCYMTELGMSVGDIDEDLSPQKRYNSSAFLKLIFPLYIISKHKRHQVFHLDKEVKQASVIENNGVITDIEIKWPIVRNDNPPYWKTELRISANAWIHKMIPYLDFASLNRTTDFTIPGFQHEYD